MQHFLYGQFLCSVQFDRNRLPGCACRFWTDAIIVHSFVFAACMRRVTLGTLVRALLIVALLELMVYGYFYRQLFGGALFAAALAVAARGNDASASRANRLLLASACAFTAVFPFLPAKMGDYTALVCIGAALFAASGFAYVSNVMEAKSKQQKALGRILVRVLLLRVPPPANEPANISD